METLSWDDLRVLLAIHRAGSLLKGGKALGMSTSTAGRRLDALEHAVGSTLVHRSQRGVELTAVALRLVRPAEDMEHGLRSQQRDLHVVAGTVRLSVPDGLARPIAQALAPFYLNYPHMNVELIGESRMADVGKREADIAVRLVRSSSHVVVEKKVGSLQFSLFGAANYVRRHIGNRILCREAAQAQRFIGLDPRWGHLPQERWMSQIGANRFIFRSGSIDAVLEVVSQGQGLAALPEQIAVAAGLLKIDTEHPGPTQPLYLIYHRDLRHTPHVRAVLGLIEGCLRG